MTSTENLPINDAVLSNIHLPGVVVSALHSETLTQV